MPTRRCSRSNARSRAVSSRCPRTRRARRSRRRPHPASRCPTRTWSGPGPTVTRRNTRRPAGRHTSAISCAGHSRPASTSISPRSTTCSSGRRSSRITRAWFSSVTTSTGRGKCATRSTPMSRPAAGSPASPATSCGRRGSRTAAAARSATSTARAPRIRRAARRALRPPGKRPKSAARGRRPSA